MLLECTYYEVTVIYIDWFLVANGSNRKCIMYDVLCGTVGVPTIPNSMDTLKKVEKCKNKQSRDTTLEDCEDKQN